MCLVLLFVVFEFQLDRGHRANSGVFSSTMLSRF